MIDMDTTDCCAAAISIKDGVVSVESIDEGVVVEITDYDKREYRCTAYDIEGNLVEEREGFPEAKARLLSEAKKAERDKKRLEHYKEKLLEKYMSKYGMSEEEANDTIQIFFNSVKEVGREWGEDI